MIIAMLHGFQWTHQDSASTFVSVSVSVLDMIDDDDGRKCRRIRDMQLGTSGNGS